MMKKRLPIPPALAPTYAYQTLIHRYSTSSSPHHLHLTAAAASFRSILQSSSLPLTPSSYFAAAISTLQRSHEDRTLTSEELAAMLSFLSIVLPMVPDEGVSAARAKEAVGVLAGKEGLGVGSLVCVVKCVGLLLVMFCDKEDWGFVEEGFRLLLGYLLDRRPKNRHVRTAKEASTSLPSVTADLPSKRQPDLSPLGFCCSVPFYFSVESSTRLLSQE